MDEEADKKAYRNAFERERRRRYENYLRPFEKYEMDGYTFEENEAFKSHLARFAEKGAKEHCALLERIRLLQIINDPNTPAEKIDGLLQKAIKTYDGIDDMSEDSETEEQPIKRVNLATISHVCYGKKEKTLSAASDKSRESSNKYSWDNIPSTYENLPSAVQTRSFDIDKICCNFKNLSSDIEN